jgi:hypothetical protein
MSERVRQLLEQIKVLEEEIGDELSKQREKLVYQIKGGKIEFERVIRERHKQLRQGLFSWLLTVRPMNLLTAPVIYGMIVPLLIFELCITFYQLTCFPIYRIPLVRRSDYFAYDHRHLAYLNIIEKFNCIYCSYANGLLAYATEVVARTEQYFCPIKHARKLKGLHMRSQSFLEYGEAAKIQQKLEELRQALINENTK